MVEMKRWITLLLTAALALSLAACNDGSSSQNGDEVSAISNPPTGQSASDSDAQSGEETLDLSDENVVEATWEDVFDDVKENEARARKNTYKVTGEIRSITNDYCVIGDLHVYLPSDVLASIDTAHTPEITVIGKITNVYEEEYYQGLTTSIIEFGEAELVELHGVSEDSEYELLTEDKFNEDMTGKTYKFTACHVEIVDETCIATAEIMNNGDIVDCPYADTNTTSYLIFLSKDEIEKIENGDDVDIIGTVSYQDMDNGNDGPYALFSFEPAMVVGN